MAQSPGLYLAALLLWFLPLMTLPSELRFLKSSPELPASQRVLSAMIFVLFVVVDLTLLFHPLINILTLTGVVTGCLLLMIILAMVQLRGRMKYFRELSQHRRASRKEMLEEVRFLIDEKKREKIRAKYGE